MPNSNALAISSLLKERIPAKRGSYEQSSRQHKKKVIADIEIGDLKISSASEMARRSL